MSDVMQTSPNGKATFGELFANVVGGTDDFTYDDFKPSPGWVLVAEAAPDQYVGKSKMIYMPDSHQDRKCMGVVLAVHASQDRNEFEKIGVSPENWMLTRGDIVVFLEKAGYTIPFAGREDITLMSYSGRPQDDILGTLKKT